MYLYGASGHSKVILEILEMKDIQIQGIFDDDSRIKKLWDYDVTLYPGLFNRELDELIVSIGNNHIRKEIAEKLNVLFGLAVHPKASVSPKSEIGAGTVMMAGAVINTHVVVGRHCIINTCASVDHECLLGDYVHISPHATLCGNVTVEEGVHVGAGAVIIPGISVGEWAVIGAGAVIIRDVPPRETVVGNPGAVIKKRQEEGDRGI